MKCTADREYKVIRKGKWVSGEWCEDWGEIRFLQCSYCDFAIYKSQISKPRTSKSGLGRYNRMRGAMVKHLHAEHRSELLTS